MPQVIVDTATESPQSLVLISRLFQDYAVLKAKDLEQAATEYPALPVAASAPAAPVIPDVMVLDPAKLFAKPSAPAVIDAGADTATGTAAVIPAAATTATPAAAQTPTPATAAAELDSANVPWDARIHSIAKGKKKDGTWKLTRGVDAALVTMVLHEITPKPAIGTAAAPVAPPVTVPPAPVPVPVAPAAGAVPVAPNPVQQFQAFMKLVAEGQAATPPRFNQAQVLDAVKAEGLAQLQLVITRPDLIPAIMARLGLV